MSLWSSFRRFSNLRKNKDSEASRTTLPSGPKAGTLKHRDLRMEQFEQRLLLSISQAYLDDAHLDVAGAWGTATGDGVVVAVIDDGIDADHPDLSAAYNDTLSWDFMTDTSSAVATLETDNHGTAIAGIIASADGGTSTGVAYDAELVSYRVTSLDSDIPLETDMIVDALSQGLDEIDVYNVGFNYSVDLYYPGADVLGAIQTGVTEGRNGLGSIYTFGASGLNSNYDALTNSRLSIAVGAVDDSGTIISAPGTATLVSGFAGNDDILTTDRLGNAGYDTSDYTTTVGFGGSQAAAAQVSGVVALMLEANPTLTYRDVQQILVENSSNWNSGTGVYDQNGLGWGTVDAKGAVEAAATWTNIDPESVVETGLVRDFDVVLDSSGNRVESTVEVASDVGSVEWVEVTLYGLPSEWAGNEITLTSPAGEAYQSVLKWSDATEATGDELADGWTFTTAAHWGEASGGDWTLTMTNPSTGQIGTWGAWELKVYGQENVGTEVGPELVSIIPNDGGELVDGGTLTVAPRELLFQFNDQQDIDDSTFDSIEITRDGGTIEYQLLAGDQDNQVIMRFAETLPDDSYQITIRGDLQNALGLPFNNGADLTIRFELDLGAQVVSVVPQPVYREGYTITTTALTTTQDGQTFTVSDGFNAVTFELNANTKPSYNSANVPINFTSPTTATNAAMLIAQAIDAQFDDDLLSVSYAGAVVSVTGSQTEVVAGTGAAALNVQSIRTLAQATDRIDVYFNDDDLNPESVTNPAFYQLHLLNETTGESEAILIPEKIVYDAEEDKAQLIFNSDLSAGTYHLQIGTSTESDDALADAVNVGTLWSGTTTAEFEGYIGDTEDGASDADLYRFQSGAGGTLSVTLTSGFTFEILDETGAPASASLTAGDTYYLQVTGTAAGSYQLALSVSAGLTIAESNTSYDTATDLGLLGAASTLITGEQIYRYDADMILDQAGGNDEPGHRHTLAMGENHLNSGAGYGSVVYYNFQDTITGAGGSGPNQITEAQKERAREIFEIYSYYLGFQVVETDNFGITVATGDLRIISPLIPTDLVAGLGGSGSATMNANIDWGESEYGGSWFNTAIHEIGHALGLGHAYDIPAIMGSGGGGEAVYPEDNDLIHLNYIWNSVWNEIDLYEFEVTEAGMFSAETIAERMSSGASNLDTQLILYREVDVDGTLVREVIAQNDDYYSNDSLIEMELEPGTYYIGVMSTGLEDVDPTIVNSGFGGQSRGSYELSLSFDADDTGSALVDATDVPLDGDADGVAGGTFDFWFQVGNNTIIVDKETGNATGPGTPASPYSEIDEALAFAAAGDVVRVVGNGNDTPYLIGYDNVGYELEDGALVQIPADVTMMIDAGAILKFQDANIEVGSSSQGIYYDGAALQVLGTPLEQVHFRSFRDDSIGGDSDGSSSGESGGDWGGLVFRDDSDYEDLGIFLNWVGWADIQHGGGKVMVGAIEDTYTSIHLESARPTIAYTTVQYGSGGAISADLASFEETNDRIGPDIHGNTVLNNSINGLFVRIPTEYGSVTETLQTAARWDDTDIIHVVTENLFIEGTAGGSYYTGGTFEAREDARLRVDPAVVVKLEGARIQTEIAGQLIAEGEPGYPVVFTSLKDDTYGMGGSFDTSNDGSTNPAEPGQWGGLIFSPTSKASLDYVQLSYAGGDTSLAGDFDTFNAIEIHQADVRIANSVIENNADGDAGGSTRAGLGSNTAAAIFIRGAQPVIVNNTIIDNEGDAISIDANSMKSDVVADPGRSTGAIDDFSEFDDNRGPLVRLNVLDNSDGGGSQLNGMVIRGSFLTAESIWDDTDVVHVLRDQIEIGNLHTYGGLQLQSSEEASLVVKLAGSTAGFLVNGEPLDIEDRIGGTLQILGTADYPVILTSLYDDTAAAGFDLNGDPQGNTYPGNQTPSAGDWDSIVIDEYANTRNVAIVVETESSFETDLNDLAKNAQFLGYLAPDLEDSLEVVVDGVTIQGTTDDEKGGDETQRLGFEVQGTVSLDATDDWDIYSFTATAGSEVWIDLDRTSYDLDAKVELVQYDGTVLASSSDSGTISGSTTVTDANGTWTFAADGLIQDDYLGDDFYGTNPLDPGMYVILPGVAGTQATYFVRVSSENDTCGEYLMQVRLRQVDEKPGTTIRYADIRYATNGVEIYGQPEHSILAAEAGEIESGNDTYTEDSSGNPTNQNLGNLLESDLAAIGVSGELTNGDVDWYRFDVDLEQIQSIGGVNDGGKTWSTVFDIDYADGISRADTVMAVYRQVGSQVQLVYIGRDSNIEDDQSAVGEGLDRDDLSRGSFDTLDAYIGPVQLPATNQTYFVAVMSAALVPEELDQTFEDTATNADVRLEPVNSIVRIVEDHIGFSGYTSGSDAGSVHIDPVEADGILDISSSITLQSHVVPYTFADVVLYVASSGGDELHTVNPFTGVEMTDVGDMNSTYGMDDIAMRGDGVLMGQTDGATGGTGSGYLRTISTEDAGLSGGGDDDLPTYGNTAQDFGALAFRDMGTTTWEIYAVNNLPYDIVNETDPGDYNDAGPALFRINSDGSANDEETNNTNYPGIQPVAYLPTTPIEGVTMGTITGMEFIDNTLYLVDDDGNLWSVNVSGSGSGRRYATGWDFIANIGGTSFTGLTLGPQNVDVISSLDADNDGFPDEDEDGVYELANVLFASSSNTLYAFTTSGVPVDCFDTNGDGLVDSSRVHCERNQFDHRPCFFSAGREPLASH